MGESGRILVVGNPRSGTTWAARALGQCAGVHYVHEPDDDERYPFARFATRGLGHLPELLRGEHATAYALMWDIAFEGGWPQRRLSGPISRLAASLPGEVVRKPLLRVRRASHRRHRCSHHLIKSVRTLFSTEWVADHCQANVLVVLRNPLNMLGGWLNLGWGSYGIDKSRRAWAELEPLGLWPSPPEHSVENTIWAICARNLMLRESAARNPAWLVMWHEDTCADPMVRYREVAGALGLTWRADVADYIRDSNRPGAGWEVLRIAEEEIEVWRRRLGADDVRVAMAMIERFEEATGLSATGSGEATVAR